MAKTVRQLRALSLSQPLDALALHSVAVPASGRGPERLAHAIEQEGLAYDARAIWIGYPNLQRAALALVALLSPDWPCRDEPHASAAMAAVLRAIRQVSQGVTREEISRDQITANFLLGLASAASDASGTVAWGFRGTTPVEPFEIWTGAFDSWCLDRKLTEVRFYRAGGQSPCEREGTRLKLLCAVASARDVGIASRWRGVA